MPELPEVETVCRGIDAALTGRTIARADVRRAGLRTPFAPDLADRLQGRTFVAVTRRAKYALVHLDDGQVLVLHLGMSGRITLLPAGADFTPARHDHFVLHFTDGQVMAFSDPRRFGMIFMLPSGDLSASPALAKLGPEPLSSEFSEAVLAAGLKGRQTEIKAALFDQRLVAGLGNIYICEALFLAGIHPARKAGALTRPMRQRLVQAIRTVLTDALAAGGSTLKDYRKADGSLGYFQFKFAVYDRAGQACRDCTCDVNKTGGVQRMVQGGRSTFYCPRKQKS